MQFIAPRCNVDSSPFDAFAIRRIVFARAGGSTADALKLRRSREGPAVKEDSGGVLAYALALLQ